MPSAVIALKAMPQRTQDPGPRPNRIPTIVAASQCTAIDTAFASATAVTSGTQSAAAFPSGLPMTNGPTATASPISSPVNDATSCVGRAADEPQQSHQRSRP